MTGPPSSVASSAQGRDHARAGDWGQAHVAYAQAFEADPSQWWHAVESLRAARHLPGTGKALARMLMFYPNYGAANSYQTLLYGPLLSAGINVRALATLTLTDPLVHEAVTAGRVAFHQHWLHEVYQRYGSDEAAGQRALTRHLSLLRALKSFRCRLLWTLHNLADHDAEDVQQRLSNRAVKEMAVLADRILVHDEAAVAALSAQVGFDVGEKCRVVPHPLYQDLTDLPPQWPAELAKLQRPESSETADKRLVVFVGRLLAYKGGRELLAALESLADQPAAAQLRVVLAGQLVDETLAPAVAALRQRLPELVTLVPRRLQDAELSALVSAADFIVMPYRRILTSGTYFLAASFGKPVLAPRRGMFVSAVEHGVDGWLYDGTVSGLAQALAYSCTVPRNELAAMGARARQRQLGRARRQTLTDVFEEIFV